MNHTQRLCSSHLGLFLRQSIQSLENRLYLALPQKFLRELLCDTLSHGQCICESVLTEPPLFDLLRSQGKHRKQFDRYFYDDLRHYRSGRNRRIDLQALEELPQALEKLEKCIVARCNPTGSLAYSFITGNPVGNWIQVTYSKKSIDAGEQSIRW